MTGTVFNITFQPNTTESTILVIIPPVSLDDPRGVAFYEVTIQSSPDKEGFGGMNGEWS